MQNNAGDVLIKGVEILRDTVTDVLMERVTRPKYHDAASVVIGVIDKRVDALETKPKPGGKQTQKDADLINLYKDIRSEIEAALVDRWQHRDGNASD